MISGEWVAWIDSATPVELYAEYERLVETKGPDNLIDLIQVELRSRGVKF